MTQWFGKAGMGKKDKTKKEKAEEMIRYTSRDLGQEFIMKRKMIRAIVMAILMAIGLAVFAALYVDEKRRVQETYRKQYINNIRAVREDIADYMNADGDFDFRYRRIVADMSSASSFAFLLDGYEEKQKTINELYTVLLKYPKQSVEKLEDIAAALDDILASLDKGYEEVDALIETYDLKGF